MIVRALTVMLGVLLLASPSRAIAQGGHQFPPEQIQAGAKLYARHCSACHGSNMQDPQGAFDLRKFPHDDRARFVRSVTQGKNSMPPWGDLLTAEDIDALWAYVVAGEAP